MKKSILLAMPEDYQLGKLIEKNLVFLGFHVIRIFPYSVHNPIKKFKYRTLTDRLLNFINKTFLTNKEFKKNLQKKYDFEDLCKPIRNFDSTIDYGLFIRADFFENDVIEYAKKRVNFLVSYHYDGLFRSEKIFDKINYFDKFYVFNRSDLDLEKYALKPATNFYFDFEESQDDDFSLKSKFYFLGSHHESRFNMLIDLKKQLTQISHSTLFEIVFCQADFDKIHKYTTHGIICSKEIIDYEDYLKKIKNTEIIIDLLINEHSGLSFRVFESLKYKKKLITNNSKVKNYNFYNPNNILVLESININDIKTFLETPYQETEEKIYEQYSFTNWLNYILEIEPNTKLNIY